MSETEERKMSSDDVLTDQGVPITLQIFLWKQVRYCMGHAPSNAH